MEGGDDNHVTHARIERDLNILEQLHCTCCEQDLMYRLIMGCQEKQLLEHCEGLLKEDGGLVVQLYSNKDNDTVQSDADQQLLTCCCHNTDACMNMISSYINDEERKHVESGGGNGSPDHEDDDPENVHRQLQDVAVNEQRRQAPGRVMMLLSNHSIHTMHLILNLQEMPAFSDACENHEAQGRRRTVYMVVIMFFLQQEDAFREYVLTHSLNVEATYAFACTFLRSTFAAWLDGVNTQQIELPGYTQHRSHENLNLLELMHDCVTHWYFSVGALVSDAVARTMVASRVV